MDVQRVRGMLVTGTRTQPDTVVAVRRREDAGAGRDAAAETFDAARVGFNHVAARRILPSLAGHLRMAAPMLGLQLSQLRTGAQLRGLRSGELDVGLGHGPVDDDALCHREVLREPVVVLVASHHPLATRRVLSLAELSDHDVLLPHETASPHLCAAVAAAADMAGQSIRVAGRSNDLRDAVAQVASGHLLTVASRTRGAQVRGSVVAIPLHDPVPELHLFMAWAPHRARPVTRTVVDAVAELRGHRT
jgi:DNA-binding transcriptional LysR family regulator